MNLTNYLLRRSINLCYPPTLLRPLKFANVHYEMTFKDTKCQGKENEASVVRRGRTNQPVFVTCAHCDFLYHSKQQISTKTNIPYYK